MGIANKYFFGGDISLYNNISLTTEQDDYQKEKWHKIKEYLEKKIKGYLSNSEVSSRLQGSYQYGTQIRPISLNGQYDIDLGIYVHNTKNNIADPASYKSNIQNLLDEYIKERKDIDAKEVLVPAKERCCRILYGNGFHIDIAAYCFDIDKDERFLATKTNGWEESDPKKIYVWYKNKINDDNERTMLRRLIKYLKCWAALKFKEEKESPSSVLLTVLATEVYNSLGKDLNGDDEYFCDLVNKIYEYAKNKNNYIKNPIANENLSRFSDEGWELFINKLAFIAKLSKEALRQSNIVVSCFYWSHIFEHFIPQLNEEECRNLPACYQKPDILIRIKDEPGYYRNEVPSVPKGKKILFEIANKDRFDEDSVVIWSVRNNGGEANKINDLGHRNKRRIAEINEEGTAYYGKHYMDCFITSLKGEFISKISVPVHILPPRNQPKKHYPI